jgi:hypothetical protein
MRQEIRDAINRANAEKSTGPRTPQGKEASCMNAFKHGFTGLSLMLQPSETEAYNRLSAALLSDFQPETEQERQLVQKITDAHFRLNRLACVENNIFNFGLIEKTTSQYEDRRIEAMAAQARAWMDRCSSFDTLGRYETRISRQLLKYTLEFERIRNERLARRRNLRQTPENTDDSLKLASFGKNIPELVVATNSFRILTEFTAAEAPQLPEPARPPCETSDI